MTRVKEHTIRIHSIDDAKLLVNAAMACDFDIDLISDQYVVDAKSIMGIFSLDLNKDIVLRAQCTADNGFFGKIQCLMY